jgi:hypothetical protein
MMYFKLKNLIFLIFFRVKYFLFLKKIILLFRIFTKKNIRTVYNNTVNKKLGFIKL